MECGFYIHISTIYPFYLFVGVAMRRGLFNFAKIVNVLALIISSLALVCFTFIHYLVGFKGFSALFGYESAFVVIQAIALFNLLRNVKLPSGVGVITKEIGKKSFGIYIVHMFYINMFYKLLNINPLKVLN